MILNSTVQIVEMRSKFTQSRPRVPHFNYCKIRMLAFFNFEPRCIWLCIGVLHLCWGQIFGTSWHTLQMSTDWHRLACTAAHWQTLDHIGRYRHHGTAVYIGPIYSAFRLRKKRNRKNITRERERDREREMTTNYVFAQVSFRLTISTLRWAMSGLSCPSTLGLCWDYICPEANRLNAELTLDRPPMEGTPSKAKVVSLQLSRIGFYQVQQIIGTPRACRISGATASQSGAGIINEAVPLPIACSHLSASHSFFDI